MPAYFLREQFRNFMRTAASKEEEYSVLRIGKNQEKEA